MLIFLLAIVGRVVLKAIMCFIGENWSLFVKECVYMSRFMCCGQG